MQRYIIARIGTIVNCYRQHPASSSPPSSSPSSSSSSLSPGFIYAIAIIIAHYVHHVEFLLKFNCSPRSHPYNTLIKEPVEPRMVSLERGPDSKLSILIVVVALIVALYRSPSLSPNSYPGRLASSQFPEKELRRGAHLCFTPSLLRAFRCPGFRNNKQQHQRLFSGVRGSGFGVLSRWQLSPLQKHAHARYVSSLWQGLRNTLVVFFLDSILEAKFRQHLCPDHLYPLAQDITSMLCLEFPFLEHSDPSNRTKPCYCRYCSCHVCCGPFLG